MISVRIDLAVFFISSFSIQEYEDEILIWFVELLFLLFVIKEICIGYHELL